MRLTAFSDYTIRVLIYIGLRPGQRATISELAEVYDISKNHLMKVVHHLGKTGYIETLRGKGGGFLLAQPPEEINIGVLIRNTEHRTAEPGCPTGIGSDCRIQSICQLKGMMTEAFEAFYNILERYTLADLLKNRKGLNKLF